MGETSSPDMAPFKRFKETCTKLVKNIYITGSNEVPDETGCIILGYLKHHLSAQKQQRYDCQKY